MSGSNIPIEVFYIYSYKDKILLDELEKHLEPLKLEGLISTWSDRRVIPGTNWVNAVDAHLNSASIILLLISADFFDSRSDCVISMQRALERNKKEETCVIPILLRTVDWKSTSFSHLQCLPGDEKFVSECGDQDAAFSEVAKGIRQAVAMLPLSRVHPPVTPLLPDQQERIGVLKRVKENWIDDVLTRRLHGAASIPLRLQDCPDMVKPLWPEQKRPSENLPVGTTIVHEYDKAKGKLLILGDPLAGKTMLLLELTRTLLERVEKDKSLAIPVVFDLWFWLSWAKKEKKPLLCEWLVKELSGKYHVPSRIGKSWIDNGQVIPLLDGLDKMAKDTRSSCVRSINDYLREHGNSSIVVCCRSKEYKELPSDIQLELQGAASIHLPLSDEQISNYLEQRFGQEGDQVKETNEILEKNNTLRDLVHQPYMLNIFTHTYQEAKAQGGLVGKEREEILKTVLSKYVELILIGRNQSNWKSEKVIYCLTFLAKQMHDHHHATFRVEHLRPTWLSPKLRLVYYVCTVLLVGIMTGLLVGLLVGLVRGPLFGLFCGLLCGLLFGLGIGLKVGKDPTIDREKIWRSMMERFSHKWEVGWKKGKSLGDFLGWLLALFLGLINGVISALIGLVLLPIFGLFRLLAELKASLNLAERPWDWENARSVLWVGLMFGLIVGLGVDLWVGLHGGQIGGLDAGPLVVVITILSFMLVGGLIAGLLGGLSRRQSPSLHEDIWESGIKGLLIGLDIGLIFAIIIGFVAGYVGGPTFGLIFGGVLGLVGGLIVALIFGLDAFVQHFIVLFLLSRRDHVPWNFTTFLEKAAEWSFLQKGDKDYKFEPPQLFDYFAKLEIKEKRKVNM